MQAFDPACLEALMRLLAQPDPPDLPPRTHVQRCEGDPNQRATRLPDILMGWLRRRHLALDVGESLASARRAMRSDRLSSARLRLVFPAAARDVQSGTHSGPRTRLQS